jgi:hypothetical protein
MEKTYFFYSKSDPIKEPIGKLKAHSYDEAFKLFITQKNLEPEQFNEIYEINELPIKSNR